MVTGGEVIHKTHSNLAFFRPETLSQGILDTLRLKYFLELKYHFRGPL